MSDEEKKAIESFKEENNNDLSRFDDFNSYTQFKVKRDKIIIDLIEKQSKEIQLLKEQKQYVIDEYGETIEKQSKEIEELTGNQCIYKDTSSCTKSISLKTYIALNKFDSSKEQSSMNYYKLYKELVDKIKAKIEELDREIEFEQNEKVIIYLHKQKRVLQSLLEKE